MDDPRRCDRHRERPPPRQHQAGDGQPAGPATARTRRGADRLLPGWADHASRPRRPAAPRHRFGQSQHGERPARAARLVRRRRRRLIDPAIRQGPARGAGSPRPARVLWPDDLARAGRAADDLLGSVRRVESPEDQHQHIRPGRSADRSGVIRAQRRGADDRPADRQGKQDRLLLGT